MPRRLHPFECLRNFPVVSTKSRDGIIYKISNEVVFKAPLAWTNATSALFQEHLESVKSIEREKTTYNLLRPHRPTHIISMILSAPEGIFLRFANEGSLEDRLALSKQQPIQRGEKLDWVKGIIEGELALTDLDLVHGDLKLSNILLHDGQVKLCDLCATVRKDDKLVAPLLPRFSRPVSGDDTNMVANEIFAIGTCIYALVMEHLPYPTMTEGEVATLFEAKQFPPTDNESFEPYGPLGAIVRGCWLGSYNSIRELDTDVDILYYKLRISRKVEHNSLKTEGEILESLESRCEKFLQQAREQVL